MKLFGLATLLLVLFFVVGCGGNTVRPTPNAKDLAVQATAEAISTENAQAVETLTATARDGAGSLQPRATEEPSATTIPSEVPSPTAIPISPMPEEAIETPTVFTVVVTGVPTPTRAVTRKPATAVPTAIVATQIPATVVLTDGQFVASSDGRAKYYYCKNDPGWRSLKPENLIWSNDAGIFIARGLKLHKPC